MEDGAPENTATLRGGPWSPHVQRALVASISNHAADGDRQALGALVAKCDPSELVSLAIAEELAGPAYETLAGFLPAEQTSRLHARARREAGIHLRYLAMLRSLSRAFDASGVSWVVLKGPALAELSYRGVVRGYADLDILVPPRQLQPAVAALETIGGYFYDDWDKLVSGAKGEVTVALRPGGAVDLHWHLVYLRSARERWTISTDDLLERRRRVNLGPVSAWTLDVPEFAAHVALHASFQGAQNLRRLLDIERTAANQPPDWDRFIECCRSWRVTLPVSAMLNRARLVLGADIPAEVVRDLAGGRFERLLLRGLGDWVPSGHIPGGRSVKNGLMRSMRDSVLSTGAEFAAETWRTMSKLLGTKGAKAVTVGNRLGTPASLPTFIEMANSADRYGHLPRGGAWDANALANA